MNAFIEDISNPNVEELYLLDDVPDMLLDKNLLVYINRSFLGLKLLPNKKKLLSKMDRITTQLKSADIIVIAFDV